jgi:hypothetical protein
LWYVILLILYHPLFLFLFPWVPQSSSTVTDMLYNWVYTWSCLILCICLSLDLSSMYERKDAFFVFLILANFTYDVLQLHPFTLKPHVIIPCGWVILHCVYTP